MFPLNHQIPQQNRGSVEELTKKGISRLSPSIRAILLQIIKNVRVT